MDGAATVGGSAIWPEREKRQIMSMNRFGVATALAVGGFLAAPAMGGITGMSYDYVSSTLTGGGDYWTVRVYADLTPGARVDAVAGNSQQSKVVSTSGTFYQNINAVGS